MKATQEQIDRYIGSPNHCPFCDHEQIEGGDREIEDGIATQRMDCKSCGSEWTDVYHLAGIGILVDSSRLFYPAGRGRVV